MQQKNAHDGAFFMILIGTPGRIRTYDLQYRKLTLYPAELRVLA
jgi:hypothetical protein